MNLFAILLMTLLPLASEAINCKGCTPLDTMTFDKMLEAFPVSLIKFDTAYPYGDKHDEFAKVAEDAAEVKRLFVGEVGIKDYGERDNEELGKRFNVDKEDYPVVFVFKRKDDGQLEHFRFKESDFSAESIKAFMRRHSGLYLPLAGCVEALDRVLERALEQSEVDWKKTQGEMEKAMQSLSDPKDKPKAEVYIKIVKKVVSDGDGFVDKEVKRTKKMMEGKLTADKKKQLKEKLNVLLSFELKKNQKDEL